MWIRKWCRKELYYIYFRTIILKLGWWKVPLSCKVVSIRHRSNCDRMIFLSSPMTNHQSESNPGPASYKASALTTKPQLLSTFSTLLVPQSKLKSKHLNFMWRWAFKTTGRLYTNSQVLDTLIHVCILSYFRCFNFILSHTASWKS